jgi:hypothetical protein
MADPITWTAIAAGVGAVASAVGTGYGVYSGERQAGAQRRALADQEQQQMLAENRATSAQRSADIRMAAANQKKPDLARLMQAATERASMGTGGTLLTGPQGAGKGTLSKTTLLGE